MLATMTDVQQAIEQLGHKGDFDGSRSFTFSSIRGESTDRETDTDADGEDWHKTARQKLAENAKMAAEEQRAQDDAEIRVPTRSSALPIDVEMSDDSGDEDESPPNDLYWRHPLLFPQNLLLRLLISCRIRVLQQLPMGA